MLLWVDTSIYLFTDWVSMPNEVHNPQSSAPNETISGRTNSTQEQLLAGLVDAAHQLWNAPDLSTSLQHIIAVLGENLAVERVKIFQNTLDAKTNQPLIHLKYEWRDSGGLVEAGRGEFQNTGYSPDLANLIDALHLGNPFFAKAVEFTEPVRRALFDPASLEIIALPIIVQRMVLGESTLWGWLSIESSHIRSWFPGEISALKLAVYNIGGAISRMRSDDAYQESEQRFRTILNSIQAAIIIVQADTHLIIAINHAAQQMIGLRYEAVIGKDIDQFIAHSTEKPHLPAMSVLDSQEGILITATGDKVPILRKPVYLTIDNSNYIVETFLSLAERKHAERIQNEQRIVAEALRDIANAINQSLNLKEVLSTILNSVDKVVPNDSANIMLIEDDITRVVACRGYDNRGGADRVMAMVRVLKDVPNLSKMAETGVPTVIPDTENATGWVKFATSSWIKSYASAPICRNGKTIGFINLNSETSGFYSPAHAERLLSFADQAAIAIENARLYENAQKEIEDRKKAEQALQQANNQLEERVEQRTIELREANQQMTLELARRVQAEKALEDERSLLAQRVEERTAELSTANAQLARAARLKDTFLASMSHELRTPLNAILNISETLQEQVYGEINPAQQKSLHRIEESGRHLLALINDILDLSKIGAGKLDLVWDFVPVTSVCQASLQFIDEAARKKNQKVLLTIDTAVKTVWADQRRLKQILVNLLSNAVKFTPQDGEISLTVTGDRARKQVRFTVSDTGIGISPDRMEYLFKPFVQLDNSLARQYEGTGLGLALVYNLIELHGGGIRVESDVAKGSQFMVTLHWDETEEPAQAGSNSSQTVDSDQVGIKSSSRVDLFFREYGIEVKPFWIESDFLNQLAALSPEVMVLDLDTFSSGLDVLREVEQDPRTALIPLLVTGSPEKMPPSIETSSSAAFLTVPYNRQDLIRLLGKITPRGTGGLTHQITFLREKSRASTAKQAQILIADDNETSGRTLADYLNNITSPGNHAFRVTIAYNGAEAIERTREINPDLILMDIQMPGMDGLEAIRRIRADEKIRHIPIIAITALAMTGDRKRCLEAGANEYMSKPLSLKELTDMIEVQLNQK
jgi:PAS domain S-box-containing protein